MLFSTHLLPRAPTSFCRRFISPLLFGHAGGMNCSLQKRNVSEPNSALYPARWRYRQMSSRLLYLEKYVLVSSILLIRLILNLTRSLDHLAILSWLPFFLLRHHCHLNKPRPYSKRMSGHLPFDLRRSFPRISSIYLDRKMTSTSNFLHRNVSLYRTISILSLTRIQKSQAKDSPKNKLNPRLNHVL